MLSAPIKPTFERFSFEPAFVPDIAPVQHLPTSLSHPVQTRDIERRAAVRFLESIDYMCPLSEPNGLQTYECDMGGVTWRMTIAGDLSNEPPPPIMVNPDTGEVYADEEDGEIVDMRICPGLTVAVICREQDLNRKDPFFFVYNKAEWNHISLSTGLVDLLWLEFQTGYFMILDRKFYFSCQEGSEHEPHGVRIFVDAHAEIHCHTDSGLTVMASTRGMNIPHDHLFDANPGETCVDVYSKAAATVMSDSIDHVDMYHIGEVIFATLKSEFIICESSHIASSIASSTEPGQLIWQEQ